MALVPVGGTSSQVGIVVTVNTAQAQQAFQRLAGTINGLRMNLQGMDLQLRSVDRVLQYLAAGAVAVAAKGFLNLAGEMERLQVQMGVFEKSAQAAQARLDQVVQLSKDAPFSIKALGDAFVKFKSAGIDPIVGANGEGPLKTLSDAVSAFGGSEQVFTRATIAIQQMAGKGVISMEELRQQLGEAIPSAVQLMAEGLGVSVSQLISDVSKGTVEFQRGIDALFQQLQEKYGGAGELLANTFFGSINRLKSAVAELAIEFNRQGGLDVFTGIIKLATDLVQRFTQFLKSGGVRDAIDGFFAFFRDNAEAVSRVVNVFESIVNILMSMGTAIGAVLSLLPAEAVTGGIIGYLLFGRAGVVPGALLGSINGAVEAMFSGVATLVQGAVGILRALGVEDVALGGLLGFLMFGRTGALIGLFLGIIEDLSRALTNFIFQAGRLIFSFAGGAKEAIASIFSDETFKVGFAKGFLESAKSFEESFRQIVGDPEKGILRDWIDGLRGLGSETKTTSGDVEDFALKFKKAIDSISEGRKKFEGTFGQPNPIIGLNPTQIQAVEKFAAMQRQLEARLASARQGGSDVISYVTGQRERLRDLEKVLVDVGNRISELTAKGQVDKAAQLRKEFDTLAAGINNFKAGLAELIQLENVRVFGKIETDIKSLNASIEDIMQEAVGDPFTQAVANIEKQFTSLSNKLQEQRNDLQRLTVGSEQYVRASEMIAEVDRKMAAAKAAIIEKTKQLNQIRRDEIAAALESTLHNFENTALQEEMAARFDDVGLAINRVKEQYRGYNEALDAQLRNLRKQLLDGEISASMYEQAVQRIADARTRLQETEQHAINMAIYQTSAVGELWRSVGDTIEESIGGALEALVTRTRSVKDVLISMYNDITRAAIRYLMTVAKNQIFGSTGGGSGLGFQLFNTFGGGGNDFSTSGGLGGLGSLFGGFLGLFADGGAMRGRIKPFASGDIIRGPTMFGLAGEAGEEAIMPLKRGPDGKLGVGAHGRGGDTYQISIQALDSRSVRELFMSEGSALVDALSSRQRINRGMRAI